MASQRSTNTMSEFLQRMISELAIAKTLPDADLQFLIGLETSILQKLREPVDQMSGQSAGLPADPNMTPMGPVGGGGTGGVPGGMPMPGGMDPAMAGGGGGGIPGAGMVGPGAMPGAGGGPGVPNVPSLPPMPNPDELRRMLGQ